MVIEVLRIGERVVRDDRATTHAALVARAFGALCIYMSGVGSGIEESVRKVNVFISTGKRWGDKPLHKLWWRAPFLTLQYISQA